MKSPCLFFTIILSVTLGSCQKDELNLSELESSEDYPVMDANEVRNVIFFLVDGMGPNHVMAASREHHGKEGRLHMERMPYKASLKTSPADDRVTDSAAGATALATGFKTLNGMVGVNPEGRPKISILKNLQQKGYATGIITTAEVTDASPASFYAHVDSRNKHDDIALQLLSSDIDIILGAPGVLSDTGTSFELIAQFASDKYSRVNTKSDLLNSSGEFILGLFNKWGAYQVNLDILNSDDLPNLGECVEKAIDVLSEKDKGFFLFVEEEGTDTGSHQNLSDFVLDRVKHIDDAIGKAVEFAYQDKHTLVIVTADHETGGLILTENTESGMFDMQWKTIAHTSQDVPFFAFGPHADTFSEEMDNTDVPTKLGLLLILEGFPAN